MGRKFTSEQEASFRSGFGLSGKSQKEYARSRGISVSYLQRLLRGSKQVIEDGGGFVKIPVPEAVSNRGCVVEIHFSDGTVVKIGASK